MRNKPLLAVLTSLCAATALAFTVHAPLVGSVGAWHTETRLWNPNAAAATVTITDVVGTGTPALTTFTIPPNGVLDLPDWAFFCADYQGCSTPIGPLLASVEFTSDQPIRLYTEVTLDTAFDGGHPSTPPPALPYYGGGLWDALAGALLHGVPAYHSPGTPVDLAWLTASPSRYRNNLYFVNPSANTLTVTASFTDKTGAGTITKDYTVAPRSNTIIGDVFADPALAALRGPVTARLVGDQSFDVVAAITAVEPLCDINGHQTLIQGEELP